MVCVSSSAQQLPATKAVQIHSTVHTSPFTGVLCFDYSILNPPANSGSIATLSIDISKQPGGADVSAEGVSDGPGADSSFSQTVLEDNKAVPMISVGLSAPIGWDVSLSVQGAAVWLPANAGLPPGGNLFGLQICSRALPGIRTVLAAPYIDIQTLSIIPPNGTAADLQRYEQDLNKTEADAGTVGITLGPVAPPAQFSALDFVKTIVSYKEQAFKQAWIDNSGSVNSLDAKLNAVQAELRRGDYRTAKNELDALVHEVDAQAGKHLTPEAVALLKFNSLYLISKLDHGEGGDDGHDHNDHDDRDQHDDRGTR